MSGRALWAPRNLDTWDWREAAIAEYRTSVSGYEKWSRSHLEGVLSSGEGAKKTPPSLILAWVGFTIAGLAALTFALSMIYGQLETALTGFPTAPLIPAEVLIASGAGGVIVGVLGLALASRRGLASESSEKTGRKTPIAA